MDVAIRNERPSDHRAVEVLTREAFWNLYVPGCDEHYLVHTLRTSADFIPELDFVAEADGRVVGNIMFSHSFVQRPNGSRFATLTFGPLSVLPAVQGQGVGGALVRHALHEAARLGHKAVLIYGDPAYYRRFGFKSCQSFGITAPDGRYPAAHQALELAPGALAGVTGAAQECAEFAVDQDKARLYDAAFPPKQRRETESQKWFAKMSNTYL